MKLQLLIGIIVLSLEFANAQQLYVGANYHPHDDKNAEKIKRDIELMKEAGFTVVRMGHLAWDSYEPAERKFDFAWFDQVMDEMNKAGIKVILDIAIRPAPLWLHHKYPSMNITDANGNVLYPNHRYMVDVGDPMYQQYALRYTDMLTKRYARHPALLAFGIDNESGDGPISYSKTVKERYIAWLKKKYTTVDSLNKAWATQRWSRRIGLFEEIGLPVSGTVNGAPERMLDFRRFISDEVNQLLFKVIDKVNTNAPNAFVNTNAWYYSPLKYFDYSSIAYSGKMTREGCGFYPGLSLTTNWGVTDALFGMARIQFESTNPFWCTEFTTMTAVPNSIRKSAYATLMYGNQMVCGWTWQSMHGGEEQYLEGMLDWDGVPNRKYEEYKKIAAEFKKIERYFPYKLKAEVGLAFSFPSQIASSSFPEQHDQQLQACFNLFHYRNMDARVVEISKSALDYKLLFVPGVAVMDKTTAGKIRDFVKNGGTVVMTANSAIVDETGQVFASTHPGHLSDVFGIRVGGFEETEALNEISGKSFKGKKVEVAYKGKEITTESTRIDVIESKGVEVLATITSLDKDYPVITANKYGKGRAIYVGLPAKGEILNPLLDDLISELSLRKGPAVPSGVMARQIDKDHFLYLNVSGEPKEIRQQGRTHSVLFNKEYSGNFMLAPYEPEFIETGN
ncbi:beta-galactosidase [Niastella koreensis]|uniref:beta-galactosidase n=2 Tax=Niastella koreensis TaxID=354356 RepID=G8TKN9_NIAKG|nr:beta-galactosidase [Niastella koreensis]AEV98713.1 Beta-galactosidase [Niastella koreensis GR20-10]OQP44953.1 beta-galactosidase [Niastella koreensis]